MFGSYALEGTSRMVRLEKCFWESMSGAVDLEEST